MFSLCEKCFKYKRYGLWIGTLVLIIVLQYFVLRMVPRAQEGGATSAKIQHFQNELYKKKERIANLYRGTHLTAVPMIEKGRFIAVRKAVALTLNAYRLTDDAYDGKLINYLINEDIKATLFLSAEWIEKHSLIVDQLAKIPLFRIEQYGALLSQTSFDELQSRMVDFALYRYARTGIMHRYYRLHAHDVNEEWMVKQWGYVTIGAQVSIPDRGRVGSLDIRDSIEHARPGDIIECDMDMPHSNTSEAVINGIEFLKNKQVEFVHLSEGWLLSGKEYELAQ